MELTTSEQAGPSGATRTEAGETDAPGPTAQRRVQLDAANSLDLRVARRMFWWGFAALPGLWLLVWMHFRGAAKLPHSDPLLRVYVHRSLVGAACSGLLLACWVVLVQTSWREWEAEGKWRWLMAVAPPPEETDW